MCRWDKSLEEFRRVNSDGYSQHLEHDHTELIKWSEKWHVFKLGNVNAPTHGNEGVEHTMGALY